MTKENPRKTGTDSGEDGDRGSDIDRQITDNLRKLYQSTVEEELPPSLQELINRLKAQDRDHD